MTEYEHDPEAGAVVLCDYGTISFDVSARGAEYRFVRHKRIKVLKRSGFDVADVVIGYVDGQAFSRLKAQTFAPDGSSVELDKKDFFDESVNKHWKRKRFTFPNLQEGSVIEYTYQVQSGNLYTLRDWYFQDFIPVRWNELRFEMIDWLNYSTVMRGNFSPVINESGLGSKNLGGSSVTTNKQRWAMENLPAMKQEDFTACQDDYRSKMQFQLVSISVPGEYYETIEWPQITRSLMASEDFGGQYTKKGKRKKIVEVAAPALAAATSPLEKAKAIYGFVNKNVQWSGDHWYDVSKDIDEVFAEGKGHSGELNLMVLALLRDQGIEAFPVVTSTRSHGKVNPYYPLIAQFDHTLVLANIDGQQYWIDAGHPLLPFGVPAVESLNGTGLLLNDEGGKFSWVGIVPEAADAVIFTQAAVDENGKVTADVTCSHGGYRALDERSACGESGSQKTWENRFGQLFSETDLAEITVENQSELQEKLKTKMTVNLPEAGLVNGDLMYLSPTIYSSYLENPFKAEERTLPVEFPYPFSEQLVTNLAVPEGFIVDGLPESIRVALPEDGGSFMYRVSEAGGTVQITSRLEVGKTFFLPEEYAALRNFFSLIEEKLGEQVVLKKRT